jgi:hypothetical protein
VGDLTVWRCQIDTNSVDHVVQFHGMLGGRVSMDSCVITGKGSLAVWVRSDVTALVTIQNCKYVGGARFLQDDSGKAISIGNTAVVSLPK